MATLNGVLERTVRDFRVVFSVLIFAVSLLCAKSFSVRSIIRVVQWKRNEQLSYRRDAAQCELRNYFGWSLTKKLCSRLRWIAVQRNSFLATY